MHCERFVLPLCAASLLVCGIAPLASAQNADEDFRFARMDTTMGEIVLLLDRGRAPITVDNFTQLIEADFYDGLIFHRVIGPRAEREFLIQAGAFLPDMSVREMEDEPAPIANEWDNGLINERGAIAMARLQDPSSATTQFFINHQDNPALSTPTFGGAGFAVFGAVIDGLEVVDDIAAVPTSPRPTKRFDIRVRNVPEADILINEIELITIDDLDADERDGVAAWRTAAARMEAGAEERRRANMLSLNRPLWEREWFTQINEADRSFYTSVFAQQKARYGDIRERLDRVEPNDDGIRLMTAAEGDGPEITEDDIVRFNVTGWRVEQEPTVFESTFWAFGGQPRVARLAAMPGIGLELERLAGAIEGSNVGDTILIELPPEYAYGATGSTRPLVPPSTSVVFEIEVLGALPSFDEIESMLEDNDLQTTDSGLEFVVIREGEGESPTNTIDRVTTTYAGWLTDGSLFDTNTFQFQVGRVIPGWTEALLDMRVGERRVLRIPSDLAYGPRGVGGAIPPNATLIFYVEMLGVDRIDPFIEQRIEQMDAEAATTSDQTDASEPD